MGNKEKDMSTYRKVPNYGPGCNFKIEVFGRIYFSNFWPEFQTF